MKPTSQTLIKKGKELIKSINRRLRTTQKTNPKVNKARSYREKEGEISLFFCLLSPERIS